jgi:3-methylcrotonyl-CoA carboxylase beta subunit
VATAQVPKFTVIIGGSFGAGNYGDVRPGVFAALVDVAERPHQRVIMAAAGVLATVKRDASKAKAARGRPRKEEAFKAPIRASITRPSAYATARLGRRRDQPGRHRARAGSSVAERADSRRGLSRM